MGLRIALVCVLLICSAWPTPAVAAYLGEEVELGNGKEFRYALELEPSERYHVGIAVQSVEANTQVNLSVQFIGADGQVKEFVSTERGLGAAERWTLLGLEFKAPEEPLRADLVLTADTPGIYRWDSLTVQRIRSTSFEAQQYWEERFAKYGPIYTGLVVDARGLGLRRGISPRVYSESGQLIYGGVLASSEFVQGVGVVAYGTELDPELIKRIQVDPEYGYALPLTVKALATLEPARTAVVISDEDAARILDALSTYDFLARYAVIFLID